VQPVSKITCSAWPAGEAVELLDEQPFRVVDEAGQLLHGGHAVRSGHDAFLLRVDRLSRLSEDVWVFGRGEDAIEVGLAEALADSEDVFGGIGRGERELIWGDSDHRAWMALVGRVLEGGDASDIESGTVFLV
jgi:hypothetical protein